MGVNDRNHTDSISTELHLEQWQEWGTLLSRKVLPQRAYDTRRTDGLSPKTFLITNFPLLDLYSSLFTQTICRIFTTDHVRLFGALARLNNVPASTLGNTELRKNTKFSVTLHACSWTYATLSLKRSPHTSFSSRFSFSLCETYTSVPTVTIARRFSGNKTADVKVWCGSLFSQTGLGNLMPQCLGVWEINTGCDNLVDCEHVNGSSENYI